MRQNYKKQLSMSKGWSDHTKRRVFNGEKVPAEEKVVSIFEPHTDIIVKQISIDFFNLFLLSSFDFFFRYQI